MSHTNLFIGLFSRLLLLGGFIIISLCSKVYAFEYGEVDTLLKQADELKGANTFEFIEVVNKLESETLSGEQSLYLSYLKGYHQGYIGNTSKALEMYLSVFNDTTSDDLKFKAGYSLFNLFALSKDFLRAIEQYNVTMSLYEDVLDHSVKFTGLLAGMMLFNELGDYSKVLELEKRLDNTDVSDKLMCKYKAMVTRARVNLKEFGYLNDVVSEMSFCSLANEPLYETFIRLDYTRLLLEKGEINKAYKELTSNLNTAISTDYKLLIQEYYYLLAKVYWLNNDAVNAEKYSKLAIDNGISAKFSLPQTLTYQLLYQIEKKKQNYQQALFYAEKYAEADKAYLDEVQTKALAVEMAESEMIEQNRRISALNQQNKLLKLEQTVDLQEQENVRLIITVMLLIILSISVWAYRTKMVQRELKRISQFDELTSIFNRRQFTFLGERAVALAQRSGKPISVIMFDLDHFKNINDSYGHSVGDTVLKKTAALLSSFTRKSDIFGRLGGEEFAFVLPDCSVNEALEFAERCRERLEKMPCASANKASFHVTASFGVTDSGLSGFDLMALLSHADHALYSAKGQSRNCVILYHQSQADLFSHVNLNVSEAEPIDSGLGDKESIDSKSIDSKHSDSKHSVA